MLNSLLIKNYALINFMEIDFEKGLSTITGETGAGKSILLGALSMVLGKRADTASLNDKNEKCIVEAGFDIGAYNLHTFFETEDIDYQDKTIIRREILPNGKSRAFINDTPCNLIVLNQLSEKLIDIHSQHETLQLADQQYQFYIVDALAQNEGWLKEYSGKLKLLKILKGELGLIQKEIEQANANFAYNSFVLEELKKAALKAGELEALEEILNKLSHIEEIRTNLIEAIQLGENEDIGTISNLLKTKNKLDRIAQFSNLFGQFSGRAKSLYIEAKDLLEELKKEAESVLSDPKEMERVNDRLQLIYDLFKKHHVNSIEELLHIQLDYEERVKVTLNSEELLNKKSKEIKALENDLVRISSVISAQRKAAIPVFLNQLHEKLTGLEMQDTKIQIHLRPVENFSPNGRDELEMLISSNKGLSFESVKKIASGGEMSRIMLAVKNILSNYSSLPTIIFDEIDTGVSGEVSNKIAAVMKQMSKNMQVITITHLPQIAAKGGVHYKVFKSAAKDSVESNIKRLNQEERISELAEMLGGKEITSSAVAHAKQLLS
ncbi:MAG: DNA repair protein RecN [Flavobacteriaceae bacterium]|nr:DNA repair protein RecN [Flavobacteriaceae bacterium]